MQESVALDTSHESSRGTTRLPSPELGADGDEFSDWDSWEGDNEVRSFKWKFLHVKHGFCMNITSCSPSSIDDRFNLLARSLSKRKVDGYVAPAERYQKQLTREKVEMREKAFRAVHNIDQTWA